MCPACIPTAALVVAGAEWAGVTALVVKAPRAKTGARGYRLDIWEYGAHKEMDTRRQERGRH
jgi:hypothetical protein